jgi:hypothetical protein
MKTSIKRQGWVVGLKDKNNCVLYAGATSYAIPIFCYNVANIFYTKKAITKYFEDAKKQLKSIPNTKGYRLFISKLHSSNNPFTFLTPDDLAPHSSGDVKIRALIKTLKQS